MTTNPYVIRMIEPTGERKYFLRMLTGEHAGAHLTTWSQRQAEAARMTRDEARMVAAGLTLDGFPVKVVRLKARVKA